MAGDATHRPADFSSAEPGQLSAALRLFEGADSDWSEADLNSMWRAQLKADLASEIGEVLGIAVWDAAAIEIRPDGEPIRSFHDLLWHANPPTGLLRLVKEFAKVSADHPFRPLPRTLAKALYVLAIAVGRRHDLALTKLSQTDVAASIAWASQQPWLDDESRRLLRPI